jgi:RNA recognition motif-containing protein
MSVYKVYVGNIAYSTSEDDLREAFGDCGTVSDSRVVTDRETGRSRVGPLEEA